MTPQDIDQEELEVYLEEVCEILQILEEDIIKLEKQSDNPSILQEIFRSAHTLKGSSAAMGFNVLAKLAHSMESVFDGVRNGRVDISMQLIDTFLHCTDAIKNLKDEIAGDLQEKSLIDDHLAELDSLLKGAAGEKEKPKPDAVKDLARGEVPAAKQPPEDPGGCRTLALHFEAGPACGMTYVRALQILTFISEIGDIAESTPSLDEIDAEESPAFPLEVILITDADISKVREVIAPISDIQLVGILSDDPAETVSGAGGGGVQREVPGNKGKAPGESAFPDAPKPEPAAGKNAPAAKPQPMVPAKIPAKVPQPAENAEVKKYASRTVRVDVERMDTIMDLVGELVINRTRLTQLSRSMEAMHDSDEDLGGLNETADNIELISVQLQENIMKARLLPIENVFNKFPRMVRDLANKSGKSVDLVIDGEKTELDRSVIEEIGDPLMHTIRNSIDHGIENPRDRAAAGKPAAGMLTISASHVEDHIQIVVEDDGAGVNLVKVLEKARKQNLAPPDVLDNMRDEEILELIFTPGFSTVDTVSELSGRGVGMDVVRTNIEKLNGNISIESVRGKGTKTLIKLPLTLAIVKALLVVMEDKIFAIPLVSVLRTLRTERSEIRTVKGMDTILFHNSVLPIVSLDEVFGIERKAPRPDKFFIVVISWSGRKVGIRVDSMIGDQEIVIRPLGEYIGEVPGISGAAILGDGRISLIVDLDGFIRLRRREMELARSAQ